MDYEYKPYLVLSKLGQVKNTPTGTRYSVGSRHGPTFFHFLGEGDDAGDLVGAYHVLGPLGQLGVALRGRGVSHVHLARWMGVRYRCPLRNVSEWEGRRDVRFEHRPV